MDNLIQDWKKRTHMIENSEHAWSMFNEESENKLKKSKRKKFVRRDACDEAVQSDSELPMSLTVLSLPSRFPRDCYRRGMSQGPPTVGLRPAQGASLDIIWSVYVDSLCYRLKALMIVCSHASYIIWTLHMAL